MPGRGATIIILLAAASLGGCASTRSDDHLGWSYRTSYGVGDASRPIAVYGVRDSMGSFLLECAAEERRLLLISVDVETEQQVRPIAIRSGGREWRGVERLQPPDGAAMTHAEIPLDHPVTEAVAAGRDIVVAAQDGVTRLEGGEIPARVVRECRALAAKG